MSEMVERVADGLIAQFKAEVEASSGQSFAETKVSIPHRSVWLGYARAAIQAMREPTKPMIDAGAVYAEYAIEAAWKEMIDAALKDDQ